MWRNLMSAAAPEWPEPGSLSPMLELEFAEGSDCGPVRPHNEDFLGHSLPAGPQQARTRGWIFALADGVGGQERGEVASRLAVETLLAECARALPAESGTALFQRAIQAANQQVYEAGHGSIATTLVACALRFNRVTVAHLGDSRCYILRKGQIRSFTRDHTLLNDLPGGGLSAEHASQRALLRSTLTRSLGSQLLVSPEISEHLLLAGDLLLLCSDGLHGPLSDAEIARIATSTPDLDEAVGQLIAFANRKDGGDNVSVQLIRVKSVEAVGMYRGRPYRLH